MKNVKKIIMFLIMLVIISTFSIVYADPNSSKGFAEYDDEQAETETQEMMEEQQKELESAAGKSTNNYLESLQVEGHEMSPEFDKQTVEYVLKGSLNTDKINIIAKPDDETGAGTIQIQDNQKEFRIDVIAESGTVRTYIIYVNEEAQEQEEQKQGEVVQPEEPEQQEEVQVDADAESEVKSESNINWIIFIVVILIVILVVIILIRKNSNNGKH